jgi:N-acetylglucosaminyl-diphospho-decaprenol L-rhamnosyltransferase
VNFAPTVDVLVVSLNTKDVLREALRTVIAHSPPGDVAQLRVRVFDNGSSDGSQDMVRTEFPHVDLMISAENVGFGRANNRLAASSTADYLLLLNSDVVVEQDIVSPLLHALESDPTAIAAGPRLMYPTGQVQYSAGLLPDLGYEFADAMKGTRLSRALRRIFDSERKVAETHQVATMLQRHGTRETDFLWATCWLVRRSDVNREGLFDEAFPMYDEDLDFCLRARRRGRKLLYVPEAELVHIGGVSSTSSGAKLRLTRAARRRYYEKHHGRLAGACYSVGTWAIAHMARLLSAIPRPQRASS